VPGPISCSQQDQLRDQAREFRSLSPLSRTRKAGGCPVSRAICSTTHHVLAVGCDHPLTPRAAPPRGCMRRLLVSTRCNLLMPFPNSVEKWYRIPESQQGWGWKGPLWVTQPNPLTKQGHPQQAAQHLVQAGLEYLQRRRLHSLPGQPGPGVRHPQREEVLSRVQMEK